jgi:hypothetical protein
MTIGDFARSVIEDPTYRESVLARARAGTLPIEVEVFLLEEFQLASGRAPVTAMHGSLELGQSRTLALIRPSAPTTEEAQS